MARTSLFSALRRLFAEDLEGLLSRRAFVGTAARGALGATVLGATGLGSAGLGGCSNETTITPATEGPIVVVGAGLAGMHCAYRLWQAGLAPKVYEATGRIGGRTFSKVGLFADDESQLIELGGELIDSGHAVLHGLATEFGLALDDRRADSGPSIEEETWFFDGAHVAQETLVSQFKAVAPAIAEAVLAADEDEAAFRALDEEDLASWLERIVPRDVYRELHLALEAAYRGEYGLELKDQSALNLIYLIDSETPDPFRVFGESDERFHTHLGNNAFTLAMADAMGEGAVLFNHRLIKIGRAKSGYVLTFEQNGGLAEVLAATVVLALPFSTLRLVDLEDLSLSDEKLEQIEELGYGTNAKVMLGFRERVWRTQHQTAGALVTDRPAQQTWETTLGQAGEHGILTNFFGGDRGLAIGEGEPIDVARETVSDLEKVWPGSEEAFTGTAVRMHWPTAPFARGSYPSCRPGQWAYFSTIGVREGDIHFCGDHTSLDYQGFMEGAAESGGLVAAQILEDRDVARPQALDRALGPRLHRTQPTFRADREALARWTPLRRLREAAALRTRRMAFERGPRE